MRSSNAPILVINLRAHTSRPNQAFYGKSNELKEEGRNSQKMIIQSQNDDPSMLYFKTIQQNIKRKL